jgi:MerR family Zn(II)-responsive transcriptional regulator of zntA
MQIGELARRTGVSVRSLRYYEARGLLSAQRLENGYRSYQDEDVDRVLEIQQYLSMGLTTDQIYQRILRSNRDAAFPLVESLVDCPNAIAFYEQKLYEIERQMASLDRTKAEVERVLAELRRRVASRVALK